MCNTNLNAIFAMLTVEIILTCNGQTGKLARILTSEWAERQASENLTSEWVERGVSENSNLE